MIGWNRVTTKGASEAVKARKEAISAVDIESGVCEGDIQLEIKPFENFSQINKYTKYLSTIENLRILSESWSEDEGFNIMVSVRVPLVLARLLEDMPEVAQVEINCKKSGYRGYKKMVVMMKTTDAVPEPVLA
jgi:hypothetical protein